MSKRRFLALNYVHVLARFTLVLAVSSVSLAVNAGSVSNAHITLLNINKDIPNVLFVQTDGSKDSNPACHINQMWTFVFPLVNQNDQQMMALLLTARATQAPVRIDGSGQCEVFGSIETGKYVTY